MADWKSCSSNESVLCGAEPFGAAAGVGGLIVLVAVAGLEAFSIVRGFGLVVVVTLSCVSCKMLVNSLEKVSSIVNRTASFVFGI